MKDAENSIKNIAKPIRVYRTLMAPVGRGLQVEGQKKRQVARGSRDFAGQTAINLQLYADLDSVARRQSLCRVHIDTKPLNGCPVSHLSLGGNDP